MSTWLKQIVVVMLLLVAFAVPTTHGSAQTQAPTAAGTWRMSVSFPQTTVPGTLKLKQNGRAVSGTLEAGFTGGPIAVEGDLEGSTLTFSGSTTTGHHPGMQLDFVATLTGDALDGRMSWPAGDLRWTAERNQ